MGIIPRIIHLIWYGSQEAESLAAAAYWREHGQGRKVIVHTDPSYLRGSWRENYERHAHNYANQSDWLRWSLMLDYGGWYFDTDIRPPKPPDLDAIEAGMTPNTCLLIPAVMGMRCLEADILCCGDGWPGEPTLDSHMREERKSVSYLQFSLILVRQFHHQHPEWFSVGDAKLFRQESKEGRQRRAKRMIATPCSKGAKHGRHALDATAARPELSGQGNPVLV